MGGIKLGWKAPAAASVFASTALGISHRRKPRNSSHRELPTLRSTDRTLSLENQISSIIKSELKESCVSSKYGVRVGICAIHLPSGEVVRVNDQAELSLASVFKVPILIEAALQLQSAWPLGPASFKSSKDDDRIDRLAPSTQLRVDETCKCIGAGELIKAPEGTLVRLDRCCALMMQISDNTATDMVLRAIGGPEHLYSRCRNFFGEL